MKRSLAVLALLTVLMLLLVGTTSASEVLPRPLLNHSPTHLPAYEKYPLWAYVVDTSATDGSVRQVNHVVNGVNLVKAWELKLALRVTEYAVGWRLPTTVAAEVERAVSALRVLFWEGDLAPLATAGIVLTGLTILLLAGLAGKGRAAWAKVVGTFVTVVLAVATLSAIGPLLRAIEEINADLSSKMFSQIGQVFAPPTVGKGAEQVNRWALTSTGEAAWRAFVLYPWAVQEFDSIESAQRYSQDEVPGGLLLEQTQTKRMDWYWRQPQNVKERDLTWWTEDGIPRRIAVAGTTFLTGSVFAVSLLLIAGSVLVYQMAMLVLVLVAPFLYVMALWPGLGSSVLRRWAGALLRVVLGQLLAMCLLAATIPLVTAVSGLEEQLGWEGVQFLLLGLAVCLIVVRRFLTLPALLQHFWRARSSGEITGQEVKKRQVFRLPSLPLPQPRAPETTPSIVVPSSAGAHSESSVGDALAYELTIQRARLLIADQGAKPAQRPTAISTSSSTSRLTLPAEVHHEKSRMTPADSNSQSETTAKDTPTMGGIPRGDRTAIRPPALPMRTATRAPSANSDGQKR